MNSDEAKRRQYKQYMTVVRYIDPIVQINGEVESELCVGRFCSAIVNPFKQGGELFTFKYMSTTGFFFASFECSGQM